jgi:hypothetical protein
VASPRRASAVRAIQPRCLLVAGKPETALRALVEKDPDGSAYQIAEGYAGCEETDLCFEWLDRARRQNDAGLPLLRSDTLLKNLHDDPRWDAFLRAMGLTDAQLK